MKVHYSAQPEFYTDAACGRPVDSISTILTTSALAEVTCKARLARL